MNYDAPWNAAVSIGYSHYGDLRLDSTTSVKFAAFFFLLQTMNKKAPIIIEMDPLTKQQSNDNKAHKVSKSFMYAFALFVSLSIIALFNDQSMEQINNATRKILGGDMTIFVQYLGNSPIAIEVESTATVQDIILMVAPQIMIDSKHLIASFDGMELDPNASVMDYGLSAECTLVIAQDPIYRYIDNKLGDRNDFVMYNALSKCDHKSVYLVRMRAGNAGMEEMTLNMDDTNAESFEEFEARVDSYFTSNGFVKECIERNYSACEITFDISTHFMIT